MLSSFDLVEEPGAVVDRDLVLGCELPEDEPEAEDQQEPEPGGRGGPARTVRLAARRSDGGATLAAVDSP